MHDKMSLNANAGEAAEGIAIGTIKCEASANTGHKSEGATFALEPCHNFDSVAGDKTEAHAELVEDKNG